MLKNNYRMKINGKRMKGIQKNSKILNVREQHRRYRGIYRRNRGTRHKAAKCLRHNYQRLLLNAHSSLNWFARQSQHSFMDSLFSKSFKSIPPMWYLLNKTAQSIKFLPILACLHFHRVWSRRKCSCSTPNLFKCKRCTPTNFCLTLSNVSKYWQKSISSLLLDCSKTLLYRSIKLLSRIYPLEFGFAFMDSGGVLLLIYNKFCSP